MTDFDWSDSDSVVTNPVRGLAAHWNNDGDVVIRIQADDPDHAQYDDAVVIPALSLPSLITRLINMHKEMTRDEN